MDIRETNSDYEMEKFTKNKPHSRVLGSRNIVKTKYKIHSYIKVHSLELFFKE